METYVCYDEQCHPLDHSMNHYSMGAVCAFLYDTVCGIRVDGRNHVTVAPVPGGTLSHAQARYAPPYGVIESAWQRVGDAVQYTITIPTNVTADIVLPGARQTVHAGTWKYTL